MNYIVITQRGTLNKIIINTANICSIENRTRPVIYMLNGESYVCEETIDELQRRIDQAARGDANG